MKRISVSFVFALIAFVTMTSETLARNYELSIGAIAGGGGSSAGGAISLYGTIGQANAQTSPVLSGGSYQLASGFSVGISGACAMPGDINHDGRVDGDDVQLFVNCLIAGVGECRCADINGSGLSPSDAPAFVAALLNQS